MDIMKGDKKYLRNRYLKIQAKYKKLNKLDEKQRPIYTYTKLLSMLSDEFDYSEAGIQAILLMDVERWYTEPIKNQAPADQTKLDLQ